MEQPRSYDTQHQLRMQAVSLVRSSGSRRRVRSALLAVASAIDCAARRLLTSP